MSTTVRVNCTVQFTLFAYCHSCNLIFSSLKLENELNKHVQNFSRMKYGFAELVMMLFI